MNILRDGLLKANIPEDAVCAIEEIVKASNGLALLLFGSFEDGKRWKHSDIDFFLLSNSSKKHTAFFKRINETLLHINVCSEKDFRAYLDKPTGRTIHALFVNGKLLFDKTEWIEAERKRLREYPLRNKILQISERLERVLHQFYQMKKALAFNENSRTIDGRQEAIVKLLEAEKIDEGLYYGKSVLNNVNERDSQLTDEIWPMADVQFIESVQDRLESLVAKYLQPLVTEMKVIDGPITPTKICDSLGIDLHYLIEVALDRGLMAQSHEENKDHGFPLFEQSYAISD